MTGTHLDQRAAATGRPERPRPAIRLRPRSAAVLVATTVLGLAAFGWPFLADAGATLTGQHTRDAPWLFVALVPLLIAVVLAELVEGGLDAKAVAVLGMLAAVGAGLRALAPGTAGLEPIFFVLVVGGRVFGPGFGFVLGAVSVSAGALLTAGVGPWLPFQMLGCAWVGFGAGCLPGARGRVELWLLAAYGMVAALGYGALLNLWFWPFVTYGGGLSFVPGAGASENLGRYLTFWLATSLGYDVPRGLLCALLLALAGGPVMAALRRVARRATFEPVVEFVSPAPPPGRASTRSG